jgi:ATP-dependent Lhr-like helicase
MDSINPLAGFHPAVADWFTQHLGEPTPPQVLGWPSIAAGQHTLILAPTGSGKTLAAFLACLDRLWKEPERGRGVQLLYISPLKALNNDVFRNLHVPLLGVQKQAELRGESLPHISVGLRTGDTTTSDRQKQLRKPPDVLITTPESLHLLLTSKGRDILTNVRWCIIDEIHVLCPNKRGVFLAMLLERLQHLTGEPGFTRIGLSATQRPLEEVARYLGGLRYTKGQGLEARPVHIVDAGQRKKLDLQVVSPVERFGPMPEKSIWPSIYRYLHDQISSHRSTIVFANNRRAVERITGAINEVEEEAKSDESKVGESSDAGLFVRAHHGSVSLEMRHQTEQLLKEGKLAGVVSTASLELGIDMGAVDLVCQVESSGNIARSMQRVGRAGHLVGGHSKGRLIPKTLPDLLEQAALAREMIRGQVEELHIPNGCLDLLAQQIVAMVSVESWAVPELYALFRQAYPTRDLTPEAFESVLEMISGRFPAEAFHELRARITWDRVHNRLHPLPGSKQLALVNGGTIPDTGQYAVYIAETSNRIGELDEEFVFERRVGDVFTLGTSAWRIESIETDRVTVSRAEGMPSTMPFWRGEKIGRSADLGRAMGNLIGEITLKLASDQTQVLPWLMDDCRLDHHAAENLLFYIKRQIESAGMVPSGQHILCEAFRDEVGDWHLAILSSLGSRFHLTLRYALESLWREQFGYQPYCLHHDDGLLLRLVDQGDPPLELLRQLDPASVEQRVLQELADSALYAIRFRHNAARALMLPVNSPQKRAPLWLQRLKSRNLLQIARQHPRFPIVIETCRECLHDHLDVDGVIQVLSDLRTGKVQLTTRRAETPSPFASQLLFSFTAAYMYDYDKVELKGEGNKANIDKGLLDQLISPEAYDHLLDPRAVEQVDKRLQGVGLLPRTAEELFEWIRRLGDVRDDELASEMQGHAATLQQQGRLLRWPVPHSAEERWILAEEAERYQHFTAFLQGKQAQADEDAATTVLQRFLQTHALVGVDDVLQRYPLNAVWVESALRDWSKAGAAITLESWGDTPTVLYSAPGNLDQVQRSSLAMRRKEVPTVPASVFAHFVQRWQGAHPATAVGGPEGLRAALERLQGYGLPRELWEQTILPSRVPGYQARWLDELVLSGEWCWVCRPGSEPVTKIESLCQTVMFVRRDQLLHFQPPIETSPLTGDEAKVHDVLHHRGAMFLVDLAQSANLSPTQVKQALWKLADRGLISNDRFDVLRRIDAELDDMAKPPGRVQLWAMRRNRIQLPEGRWALLPWSQPDAETRAIAQVQLLLERYGIVSKDLAGQDSSLFPWRVLYEVLSRLELSGEVRRGYFVDGLSGAQFALPDAVEQLAAITKLPVAQESAVLLHAYDPANLYGPSGPLGWPLGPRIISDNNEPEGPTWSRRSGNWLITLAGTIVLAVESGGKAIWTNPQSSEETIYQAIQCLPDLLKSGHGTNVRAKLVIEEWNGQPVTSSPARRFLEAVGFVSDYHSLCLYAAWTR